MLLDSDLADFPAVNEYKNIHQDSIFIGCEIKHLYDEKRIKFNNYKEITPDRYSYKPTKYLNSTPFLLYGFCFNPKGEDKHLINELRKLDNIDLLTYNNILEKYNYKTGENYIKLVQNIYPLDTVHIERYMPEFNFDNVFMFDLKIVNFQQVTSINMYILLGK